MAAASGSGGAGLTALSAGPPVTLVPGQSVLVGSPREEAPYTYGGPYLGESEEGGALVALPGAASVLWDGTPLADVLDSMGSS